MATMLPALNNRTFERFNEMMEDFFEAPKMLRQWIPAVDIKKTDKEYTLTMELPGIERKDVHVEMAHDILTIRGHREHEAEEKGPDFIRRERNWGEFTRSFKLDEAVQPEMIKAEIKDGLLTIVIPKVEPAKAFEVEVG